MSRDADVLIIGGGATGLGTALDAASRGYATALVEASDFGSGTSSRSTKLLHGGVRYLAQFDFKLVRQALRERAIVRRNAAHLVHDLGFLCPAYRWFEAPYFAAGLALYDALAGDASFGRSRLLSRAHVLARAPGLRPHGLHGGVRYHDGQFDDAALAAALARTATLHGAIALDHTRALRFLYDSHRRICGALVRDERSGSEREMRARVVVNATGPFADELRILDDPQAAPLLRLSRGTHIILPKDAFDCADALLVPRTDDGRVLFAIPWKGALLVGTTDVPVERPALRPQPSNEETEYLLLHLNRYLSHAAERRTVLDAFAGLRPLVARKPSPTARLSREHAIEISRSGLVTIAGGKWTTYRKMAQDTVDAAALAAGLPAAPCVTESIPVA